MLQNFCFAMDFKQMAVGIFCIQVPLIVERLQACMVHFLSKPALDDAAATLHAHLKVCARASCKLKVFTLVADCRRRKLPSCSSADGQIARYDARRTRN